MQKSLKRLTAWVVVVVSLLSVCFLPSLTQIAFAENTAAGQNAINYMKQAARVQAVTFTFKRCLEDDRWFGGGSSTTYGSGEYIASKNGDIFENDWTMAATEYTGAWLEHEVQGKVDDGAIWCGNNNSEIIKLFMRTLDIHDLSQIYCNGNDPGIFYVTAQQRPDDDHKYYWDKQVDVCASAIGDKEYKFHQNISDGNGMEHIKRLYDTYKDRSNNPYLTDFDDLSIFDNDIYYYILLNDFYTSCAGSEDYYKGDINNMSASYYFATPLKILDPTTGNVEERYFSNKHITKSDWKHSIVNGGSHTCDDVIDSINGRADAILHEWQRVQDEEKKKAEQAAKDSCLTRAQDKYTELNDRLIQIAHMLSGGVFGEERDRILAEQSAIMEVMQEIQRMINDGTYYEVRSDGAVYCATLPSVEPGDDDDNNGPVYEPPTVNPDITDDPASPGASTQSACYESAGVLGWIACPVIGVLGTITQGLYSFIENDFLEVDASMFTSDTNAGGIREGWNQIRNIANILFAIAFIIVILAQVTGIGISNYNIKKILPRLIMVVVLVNLSFIICQLLVDVSNIVGSGLKSMFDGFAEKIPLKGGLTSAGAGVLSAVITTLLGVGAGGIAVAVGFTVSWQTWLFPLLIGLVGVVVGIFFFFLVMSVRKAGIIILIVLAPAAIVCYALPNTQNIYKRWQKMFISLLMVYPICGALMGGGAFAARIILSGIQEGESGAVSNGFLMFTAALVQVVPFFMIPTIVRSSMNAMGNIGAKIAGVGSRFGKWGQARVENTRWAKAGREARQNLLNDRYQCTSERTATRNLKRMQRRYESNEKRRNNGKTGLVARLQLRVDTSWERRNGNLYSRAILRHDAQQENQAKLDSIAERGPAFEGTQRYRGMMARVEEKQLTQDTADAVSTLSANTAEVTMMGLDASGAIDPNATTTETLNSNNLEQLTRYYEYLARQSIVDPSDKQNLAHMQATQQLLMQQRDKGVEAIYNTMAKIQSEKDAATDNFRYTNDQLRRSSMGRAISTLMAKSDGDVKAFGGKSVVRSLQDIQAGNYTDERRSRFRNVNTDPGHGPNFVSSYSASDASSITPAQFNDKSDEWFARMGDAVRSGNMSANEMSDLARAATDYVGDETLNKDNNGKTLRFVRSLLSDISSNNSNTAGRVINNAADPNNGALRPTTAGLDDTLGSNIMAQASPEMLDTVIDDITNAGNWNAMDVDTKMRYATTVANAQHALRTGTLTQGNADRLRQVLQIAQNNGYNTADPALRSLPRGLVPVIDVVQGTGKIDIPKVESSRIKIDRNAPRKLDMPDPGWHRRASDGVWVDGSNHKLKGNDLARANSIEQHNINVDIQNNNPSGT